MGLRMRLREWSRAKAFTSCLPRQKERKGKKSESQNPSRDHNPKDLKTFQEIPTLWVFHLAYDTIGHWEIPRSQSRTPPLSLSTLSSSPHCSLVSSSFAFILSLFFMFPVSVLSITSFSSAVMGAREYTVLVLFLCLVLRIFKPFLRSGNS